MNVALGNDGQYATPVLPVQGFVVLADTNLAALTAVTDRYFQKLWIYPGVTAANSKVAQTNSAAIYVGKKGRKIVTGTVTLAVSGQVVTATLTSHGFSNNDLVNLSGATPAKYNGNFRIQNVTTNTFDFVLTDAATETPTGTITVEGLQALNVTPDVLQPTDGPIKYELPLGQKMRLSDVIIQGSAADGVFYSVW